MEDRRVYVWHADVQGLLRQTADGTPGGVVSTLKTGPNPTPADRKHEQASSTTDPDFGGCICKLCLKLE